MPSSPLSRFEFWYEKDATTEIDVVCMLPNGICLTFPQTPADTALCDIKERLWVEAEMYPLFHLLQFKDDYVFQVVSSNGGTEDLVNENLSLFDVKPVRPFLKITLRYGDEAIKLMNSKISMVLGRSITSKSENEEVEDLRRKYVPLCEYISRERGRSSWERRAMYSYPPELDAEIDLSNALKAKLVFNDWKLRISVSVLPDFVCTFDIPYKSLPMNIIRTTLKEYALTSTTHENINDYVLKVLGRLEYFFGNLIKVDDAEIYVEKPIIQYKYIHDCLLWNRPIKLCVVTKFTVDVEPVLPRKSIHAPPSLPDKNSRRKSKQNKDVKYLPLWNINSTTNLKIKIVCASNVGACDWMKAVECGIFHGSEELCESKVTSQQTGMNPCWNEYLEFDLPVSQLPQTAKLCCCIVGYRQKDKVAIAWVNMPIFSYKGLLKTGSNRLYCWTTVGKKKFDGLNPLFTVACSGNENGPCIIIDCIKFICPVSYPNEDEILSKAVSTACLFQSPYTTSTSKSLVSRMEEIIKKDSLASLFEEEKELLWHLRQNCKRDYPQSLPKLLQCVKWNCREDVAQMRHIVLNWKKDELEIETALDLLDYSYPDVKVRELAVNVLDKLSDSELEMYLLQLVQALKYELYLDSPLLYFLLKRALNNRRIGHYLFWHLKADVCNPECSLQFGLLLELYCRGSGSHIDTLLQQVEAMNKLKTVNAVLGQNKDLNDAKQGAMFDCFRSESYVKVFTNLISPLDPRIQLKQLKVEKCKILKSAKKPLLLVFENSDKGGGDIKILFKAGDDLRQDMLTLLSLRLMDNVWKKAGQDYGIIPYRCLSTGPMVGLIEFVKFSETISEIQWKSGISSALNVKKDTLYNWIVEKSDNSDETLATYIENFTRSVVGYSVATFVLGIGDRHNDNIMMKSDTGQLFHIDFGHFLGNFKVKFGIRRERVKFVLPDEFTFLIGKAQNRTMRENFNNFKTMCIDAFITLRSKGNLFISVFAMLLSTGIPELEHPNDLDYLRDSLAMTKDETDAVDLFEASFREAHDKRRHTSVMWAIHIAKKHLL